jgi:hypothetical protein
MPTPIHVHAHRICLLMSRKFSHLILIMFICLCDLLTVKQSATTQNDVYNVKNTTIKSFFCGASWITMDANIVSCHVTLLNILSRCTYVLLQNSRLFLVIACIVFVSDSVSRNAYIMLYNHKLLCVNKLCSTYCTCC